MRRALSGSTVHRLLGALLTAAVLPANVACSGEPKRPHVILVVIDTLRADRLGAYGYPRRTSPVLDQLAREGVLFEECVAQAPWTLQSMPSMLTGKYTTEHREWPDEAHVPLAQCFRKAGYTTVGASANELLSRELHYHRGFDVYDADTLPGKVTKPFDVLLADTWPKLDAARAKAPEKPLFLYLQPFDPHFPYLEHHDFDAELPTDETEPVRPEGWQAEAIRARGSAAPADDPGWERELIGLRHQRGLYDQCVRFTDTVFGKLLDGLRERGLLDDAVIAVVSDHGEGLWEHVNKASAEKLATLPPNGFFFAGHAYHVYEEAVRTPFVLWGRGVPSGVRVPAPVENVDLYPTLCALAGVPAPAPGGRPQLDGRDLTVFFDAPEADRRAGPEGWRDLTFAFMPHVATVRERSTGWKLVAPTCSYRKPEDGVPTELFHLPSDPDERANRLGGEPATAARLLRILQQAIEAHPTRTTWGHKKPPAIQAAILDKNYAGVGDNPEEAEAVAVEPDDVDVDGPRPPPDPRVDCDGARPAGGR